ncbi:MAG: hypothetical protein ACHQUC_05015 [Chlamydiales bacterium]
MSQQQNFNNTTVAPPITGTGQTVNAGTVNLITLPAGTTPGTYSIEGRAAAFEPTTPAGAGFQFFGTVRTTGLAATVINPFEIIDNAEVAIDAAKIDVVTVGNNIIVQATGVLGFTIDWASEFQYTFVG